MKARIYIFAAAHAGKNLSKADRKVKKEVFTQ
jgi:hypothetical protein